MIKSKVHRPHTQEDLEHTKIKSSFLQRVFHWLGRQNIFLLLFFVVFVYFGVKYVYASFTDSPQEEIVRIIPSPSINTLIQNSPTPVNSPSSSPTPTLSPLPLVTFTPTPVPTPDLDPIVKCTIPIKCGGQTIDVKSSVCQNSVCCSLEEGTYESLSKEDCQKKQDDIFQKWKLEQDKKITEYEQKKKEYEEAKKNYEQQQKESLSRQIEESNQKALKLIEETTRNMEKSNQEYENRRAAAYKVCLQDATRKAYILCSANNACDSQGYGSPDWIKENEIEKCKILFGF